MGELVKLKGAIFRATNPGRDGEGDPTAMVEINQILQENPNLIMEAVKNIKARVKDKSPQVSVVALDLLDQCMQSNGFQFQVLVMKKVLSRVLKLATPGKGNYPNVQQKAGELIRSWSRLYGADGRMSEYANSAKELARSEEKVQLQQRALQDRQQGLQPMRPGLSSSHPNASRPQGSNMDAGYGDMREDFSNGNYPPDARYNQEINLNKVDLDQGKEYLALLSSMLTAEDASNLHSNEALAEVVMMCKACVVAIQNQVGEIQDEARLMQFLTLNDQITEKLNEYEDLAMGKKQPTTSQHPTSPNVMMNAETPVFQSPLSASYDEDEELRQALAESTKTAAAEKVQASKREDMNALEELFGSPKPPPPPSQPFSQPMGMPQTFAASSMQSREDDIFSLGPGGQGLHNPANFSQAPPPPPPVAFSPADNPFMPPPVPQAPAVPLSSAPMASKANVSLLDDLVSLDLSGAGPQPPPNVASSVPAVAMNLATDPFSASLMQPPNFAAGSMSLMGGFDSPGSHVDLSVEGQSPGATYEQMYNWLVRLAVNKEGVLYEDSFVQIGVKSQYSKHNGKLAIFVGNKMPQDMTNFTIQIHFSQELSGSVSSHTNQIAAKQQLQLTTTMACSRPFVSPIPMTISFASAAEQRVLSLKLPVVPCKFMTAVQLSRSDFDAKWAFCSSCGQSQTLSTTEKWMNMSTLKAMLTNGLHFGLVADTAENSVHGCGLFEGSGLTSECCLQMTANQGDRTLTMTVNANDAALRESVEFLLHMLLAANNKPRGL